MTQNIYDSPDFFEAYSRIPRQLHGFDGAPEWPSLRAMLPDLAGTRIVDLGCGFGWFCRWARSQGASEALGIDVSENMLARAEEMTQDTAIRYERADLEALDLPEAAFDLAYSSLAFHYVERLDRLFEVVRRALKPGGSLVFSAEHPLLTAPSRQGWTVDAEGKRRWPIDSYLREGRRTSDWLAEGVIKQHRTFGTYFNLLVRAGFTVTHLEEWGPTDAQIASNPDLAEERERPTFFLMAARR
jgi:ubiquinone/menaquinone biosynthesis C-methylase UbiE